MQTVSNKKQTLKNIQLKQKHTLKNIHSKDNMSHIHIKQKNVSIDEDHTHTQTLIRVIEHDLGDYNW